MAEGIHHRAVRGEVVQRDVEPQKTVSYEAIRPGLVSCNAGKKSCVCDYHRLPSTQRFRLLIDDKLLPQRAASGAKGLFRPS